MFCDPTEEFCDVPCPRGQFVVAFNTSFANSISNLGDRFLSDNMAVDASISVAVKRNLLELVQTKKCNPLHRPSQCYGLHGTTAVLSTRCDQLIKSRERLDTMP